jgi:hypothetical protein
MSLRGGNVFVGGARMHEADGWVPTRSRGTLGTWSSDGFVRYWYASGEIYRSIGDDMWRPLEGWGDGAWTPLAHAPAYVLMDLDAVPITAEDAEAFVHRERS